MESSQGIARIKLKVGSMELEYEGDPGFLTGGIEALLVTMGGLADKAPLQDSAPGDDAATLPLNTNGSGAPPPKTPLSLSTNTIAANLSAGSGSELVICALAQLELIQGKLSSSRHEIIAEMKNATTYFKQTMVGNLTGSINTLMKAKRINQISKDTYSLSAAERKQVEGKLANIG